MENPRTLAELNIKEADEIWEPIVGYEDLYLISNYGRIYSFAKNIVRKNVKNEYYCVKLYKNKKGKKFSVHRLVALHFLPNPENKTQVNHKDGNKYNNYVDNLEWVTNSENCKHAYKTGLKSEKGENNNFCRLKQKDVDFMRKSKLSRKELMKMFDISKSHLSSIINYKVWNYDN